MLIGTTIVTDSLTSDGEESHLAIETSGHGALKENHWLDDGAYLMVKVLNKLASARASGSVSGCKLLTDLVEGLEEPGVSIELRFKIDQSHADVKGGSFRDYGEAVLKHLEKIVESEPKLRKTHVNHEGVSLPLGELIVLNESNIVQPICQTLKP